MKSIRAARLLAGRARWLAAPLLLLAAFVSAAPPLARADGICSQILQCVISTARTQLPLGSDVCDVCNGNGSRIVSSVQQAIATPSITSACGAANHLLWVAQSVSGADFTTALKTLSCVVQGGGLGSVDTCQAGCQPRCARQYPPPIGIPSTAQFNDYRNCLNTCTGGDCQSSCASILPQQATAEEVAQANQQYNGCLARCGCGVVQQTVCGGGGEQYSAEQICKAVGLSDSAAPPTSMQLVNTVNVTNIKSLTDAALLNLKLLYIVNRSSCAYLVPNGRDVPPVLWRYSPHSPAIWQLEDAGANSFYVRATINGYYLTATAGKIQLVFPANADSKWLISPVLGQSAAQVPLAMTFTVANVTDPTVTLTAGPAVEQTTGLSTSTAPLTTGPVPAGGDARMAEWTVQPYGPEEPFGSPPPPCPQ